MAIARRRATLALARKEVIHVPTEMLTRDERVMELPRAVPAIRPDEHGAAARRYHARVRRLLPRREAGQPIEVDRKGVGYGRRQGASTTTVVHQGVLACTPKGGSSERRPKGALGSAPR